MIKSLGVYQPLNRLGAASSPSSSRVRARVGCRICDSFNLLQLGHQFISPPNHIVAVAVIVTFTVNFSYTIVKI